MKLSIVDKEGFVFEEKLDQYHILAISLHKCCVASRFLRFIMLERFSVDRKVLIGAMIEDIEK